MSFDERAWYGGGYYEPPPPPPPGPTMEGGAPPPDPGAWAAPNLEVPQRKKWDGDALVLGRFLPVHSGHVRLLATAAAACRGFVHVGVSTWRDDFIDFHSRRDALQTCIERKRYGGTHAATQIGKRGEPDDDSFWAPWVDWVKSQAALSNCRVLVSGEPEAKRFAELAGLNFELVDRSELPLSATAVRRAPWKYWNDIAPSLRANYFTSSIALVGPEGTGKTTLASSLGRHFKTSVAFEYLPDWLRGTGNTMPTQEQMAGVVWTGQRQSWDQARLNAFRFFVADTDQLTIALWARRLFGEPIRFEPQRPGFTLLMDDALPWKGPKDRDEPEARKQMVIEFRRLLTGRGWPFAMLTGPREGRFAQAVDAIHKWIRSNPLER